MDVTKQQGSKDDAAVVRCSWANSSPLMQQYHDLEWGVPQHDSRALWELLMLEGFQAGLSWNLVLKKREALRKAFNDFDPAAVAAFDESDIARLMDDKGIIRARAKILATITGARIFLKLQETNEDFGALIWQLHGGSVVRNHGVTPTQTPGSTEMSLALKKMGFKFVGPTIVYAFMQAAGMVNDHAEECFRREAYPST